MNIALTLQCCASGWLQVKLPVPSRRSSYQNQVHMGITDVMMTKWAPHSYRLGNGWFSACTTRKSFTICTHH